MPSRPSLSQPPDRAPRWQVIGALIFLAVSLIASGVLLINAFFGPITFAPARGGALAEPNDTSAQSASSADQTTPDASLALPTPTPEPPLVIGLMPLNSEASVTGEQVSAAVQEALQSSPLAGRVVVQTFAAPADVQIETLDIARDAPDSILLIAWAGDGGLTQFYIVGASQPDYTRLDRSPNAWIAPAPGGVPLLVADGESLTLPAGLAAAALEIAHADYDPASQRLQALAALPSAIPLDQQAGNQAILQFSIARTQSARGDYTGALQTYSQALRLLEDFPAAEVNRGSVYLSLGDPLAALTAYQGIPETSPAYPIALHNQVIAYWMNADLDSALGAAGVLAEATGQTGWGINLRGVIHNARGEYQAALDDFALASQHAPDEPAPLFNSALTQQAMGDFDAALAAYDTLLDLEPNNPVFHLYLGLAYQAAGRPSEAQYAFNRAIDLDRSYTEAYLRRAILRLETEDYDGALDDAAQVLALNPEEGRAYAVQGGALLAQEQFEEAQAAYSAAIERGAGDAEVYAGRGWARHRRGQYSAAVDDYNQAIALGADDPVLLLRLGFALYDTASYAESLMAFTQAVDGGLNTAEAHAGLAIALDANLQRDEAEQEYQRALDLDPQFADPAFLSEQILWSQGAVTRAVTILRRMGLVP